MEYGKSITDACVDWEETKKLLNDLAQAVKARRQKYMEFKFKREIAETLGLNTAVLLEYITNSELQKCKIEFLLKELSFWDENELMSLLIDLNVRGLVDLDTEKKLVSLTKGQPKTKLQTPRKIKRSNIASDWLSLIHI